jgi:hypothetical protein
MNVSKLTKQTISRAVMVVVFCLLSFTAVFASTENNRFSLENNAKKLFKPTVTFKAIWIDYDVIEKKQNGMRIHLKFTVTGMRNVDSYLAIYFIDEDGNKLQDSNGKFNSTAGDVAVYFAMKPAYATTDYNDLSVFMPYSELDLEDGEYRLKIDADIIYKGGGLVEHLTFKDIDYSQG